MNIYFAIAGAVVVLASYAGTFYVGADYGESKAEARAASTQDIADAAAAKSAGIAAKAISGIKVQHQNITQKVIREIQTNTVYADCRHSDGVFKSLNEALTGRSDPAADSKLPAADSAPGQDVRSDDAKAVGAGVHVPAVSPVNRPGG